VLLSSQNDLNELLVLERGVIEVQVSPIEPPPAKERIVLPTYSRVLDTPAPSARLPGSSRAHDDAASAAGPGAFESAATPVSPGSTKLGFK
jgi:hypothetical protein